MSVTKNRAQSDESVRARQGIILDVGCGSNKQPRSVGMDRQALPGVDVVHNWDLFPWPFEDESVLTVIASHVIEHVNPINGHFLDWMSECWRILRPGGQIAIGCPYGVSSLYVRDPTHCLTDGAEVLTENGFKRMQDVTLGEDVLTLNPRLGSTEYAPVVRVFDEPYEGDILRFKNRRMDIAVTPNHDLLWHTHQPNSELKLSAAETFEDLCGFGRRGIATVRDWKGDEPSEILEWMAGDFMELLGWLVSEGSLAKVPRYPHLTRAAIHQDQSANRAKYERIEILLDRLGLRYRKSSTGFFIDCPALVELMEPLGLQPERYVPTALKRMSVPLLKRFLQSAMLGDGEKHPNGIGMTYTSTSPRLASDINEIALKCGMRSGIALRPGGAFESRGKTYVRRDQHRVSVTPDRPMLYPVPTREHYAGRITCVQAARNHTILTRQNGKCAWVGNCNPCNEETFWYFDPEHASGFYGFYQPAPWQIEINSFHSEGMLEVVMRKREDLSTYHSDEMVHWGKGGRVK